MKINMYVSQKEVVKTIKTNEKSFHLDLNEEQAYVLMRLIGRTGGDGAEDLGFYELYLDLNKNFSSIESNYDFNCKNNIFHINKKGK